MAYAKRMWPKKATSPRRNAGRNKRRNTVSSRAPLPRSLRSNAHARWNWGRAAAVDTSGLCQTSSRVAPCWYAPRTRLLMYPYVTKLHHDAPIAGFGRYAEALPPRAAVNAAGASWGASCGGACVVGTEADCGGTKV